MKCMCAQTRPRFILSSEGVFGGMEFEPMLTPREKSPLPEKVPRGGSNPRRCGQRAQALPTELFRPPSSGMNLLYVCRYIFVHVTVYMFMCRHVYVHGHGCFMYVHMCTYCICMYVMAMHSAVRIPLVSNFSI